MQSAKSSQQYKFDQYDVVVTIFSDKKLEITVVDPFQKIQFHEKLLTLNNISTMTLLKALERKMLEVKMGIKVNKTSDNAILQIDVLVASLFLKPVEQTIYLKKSRDISESQVLKNAVNLISSKIKLIKQDQKHNINKVRVGTVQQNQKTFNTGTIYQSIGSIKLTKGKYVITISFLVKATNSWMYLYHGQGQVLIQNSGFYVPSNSNYIPMVFRKTHTVSKQQEDVSFTTYYGQSYPVSLKNVVITAQEII